MRRLVLCGALVLLGSACGSPQQAADTSTLPTAPATTTTPPSGGSVVPVPPTTGAPETPASTRCTASSLAGEVGSVDSGAGNRYAKFVVANNGSAQCTLNGYSGFQLLDGAGQPLPTNLQRTEDPAPVPITLPPGAQAAANLRWTVVATGDEPVEGPCEPEPAKAAAIPPDETQPMTVAWSHGPVCGGGKIEISAFYPA
ncbi:DUF4232 domain-containing protein [Actinosynnema sp. NPDC047251]|uniref:Putative secreted protein n=1 Tax=Saccharothrix espanaensis (strain ATCC 51144 / DSM 44229 / JCM 9112 / NBRC 15066 / NRRL 15764) TaxID=1179773 RepID=K0JSU9_SACES|nr:DUF4232 domain-containing protein [Saccharothrix espanaensis]CCH27924.1 putative secreted protein [Saccharothrix espanaensis DSM 44229]